MTKYHAKTVTIMGKRFASRFESEIFLMLHDMEKRGQINKLELQRTFVLHAPPAWEAIGRYVADFSFGEGGRDVVLEAKGFMNPLAKWKLRHFQAEYHAYELRVVRPGQMLPALAASAPKARAA